MKEVLIYAAENGNTNLLIAALKLGADPNCSTHFDNTPLLNAAYFGQVNCIKLLLNADHVNDMGETPIMQAAKNGHTECVRLLKPHSHEYDMKDNEGKTVFDYAANHETDDILRILNESEAETAASVYEMPVYDSELSYEELINATKDTLRERYFTQKDMELTPMV